MLSILPLLPVLAAQAIFQPPGPASATAVAPGQPQAILRKAIVAIEARPSFSASVRHQVHLFDKHLFGSGSYQELRRGGAAMVRLELSIQIGNQVSSLLQVCDGKVLWTYRKLLDETSLTRIDAERDLRRFKEVAAAPGREPPATLPGLGGLSWVLRGLDANFHFTSAELGRVKQPVKYVPVWRLEGGWRPERLMDLLPRLSPEQKTAIKQGKPADTTPLPKQLPDRVVLLLGQEDLFPYRIEYRRAVTRRRPAAKRARRW